LIRKAIERYRERAAAASVLPSGPKPVTPATRRLVAKVPVNADGRVEAALSVTDEGPWEAPPEPVDIDGTFRAIPQLDDGHRVVDGTIQWHWRIEGSGGDG